MSLVSREAKQDVVEPTKGQIRCRIPQRMPNARLKLQPNKPKPPPEILRPKFDAVPLQQRCPIRNPGRPRSNEVKQANVSAAQRPGDDFSLSKASSQTQETIRMSRPKSANRVKDDLGNGRPVHTMPRSARPERDRFPISTKKHSTIPKKIMDFGGHGKPMMRAMITVPRTPFKNMYSLPDQETITKQERYEDLDDRDGSPTIDKDLSLCSQSDNMLKIKMDWQQNMSQFEKMKNDLNNRQKAILEFYALMRNNHSKMTGLGQKASLPSSEDLRIMNVSKLTAEQLLQLCAVRPDDKFQRVGKAKDNQIPIKTPLAVDMNKLYAMPSKLVATCEQTLFKRKEIIDWFETLKTEDKGIAMNKLTKKINEFNSENEMLKCSLEQAKGEFITELNEIIEYMRKTVNETVDLQLRIEELTYTLSDLNSQNNDLRKQLHNSDHLRSHTNKVKVEELEKELKEERCKKIVIKDRLSRAEGQIKIGVERASQLEAALEQARSQSWALERTVQQLHDQNQSLQSEFDSELNKLRESIRKNTAHLEEIAVARENLQTEKEDLEKRLGDLSNYYNESLQTAKLDMNVNVAKLIEAEKKYEEEVEEKHNVEVKLESLQAKLLESELRFKDLTKELQETKEKLGYAINFERELSSTKRDLDIAVIEIEDYKKKVAEQSVTIQEYENNIKESINLEENLKSNLITKDKHISDLEKKLSLLEKQLQESESKMESYEEQLSRLKNNIADFQQDFGEFENLNELHEMVNQQRVKLLEATRQNGELAEALQKKDVELEQHIYNIADQEQLLEQRNGVIKMLSGKVEEQTNIIKLLRNNLEMRTQADVDVNQQLTEKNAEIEALITNVETRKLQITQLEKILLVLEEQMRKVSMQKRKDQEKINLLEHKIAEYETYYMEPRRNDLPLNNLDNIIKIIEDELGTSIDPSLNHKEHDFGTPKKKYIADRRRDKLENFECHKGNNNQTMQQNDHETVPTKIVMGNFVKKTYIPTKDEQFNSDNLNRKKAITNKGTQKWIPAPEPSINIYANTPTIKDNNYLPFRGLVPASSHIKDNLLSRNIQLLTSNQLRDEKKLKMFKIAGHRL